MRAFDTAIGTCGVAWSEHGITRMSLPAAGLGASTSDADAPDFVEHAMRGVAALLRGEPRDLREVPLDTHGLGAFEQRVYAAARDVGPGETTTYGDIARRVGDPGAARAVGAALGRNPFAPVVPCHRILAADGALHGFSAPGGIATKRRMLEIEGAPGFRQEALFSA